MAQKKKLQVFVSSTYTDLQEERQAAVQAILTAGHIPAGMELFAAGDETQMNVIKRWIDESDVYMLILGGRYGSIELKSQKSYIHLEYEYAVEKSKALFAVVINKDHLEEKVKKHGTKVVELEHPDKLKEFRELVSSKMVRFWSDPKDIKLSILETMADFANRSDLIGWLPGNEAVNAGVVAEEIARLANENSQLRDQLANSQVTTKYGGVTFDEMVRLLTTIPANDLSNFSANSLNIPMEKLTEQYQQVVSAFSDSEPNLLHFYWILSRRFALGLNNLSFKSNTTTSQLVHKLLTFGLIERAEMLVSERMEVRYRLSDTGRQFLNRLRIERDLSEAEKFVI